MEIKMYFTKQFVILQSIFFFQDAFINIVYIRFVRYINIKSKFIHYSTKADIILQEK